MALPNEETKKKVVLSIRKGMKTGKKTNDFQDFQMKNTLQLAEKSPIQTQVINKEFENVLKQYFSIDMDAIERENR